MTTEQAIAIRPELTTLAEAAAWVPGFGREMLGGAPRTRRF